MGRREWMEEKRKEKEGEDATLASTLRISLARRDWTRGRLARPSSCLSSSSSRRSSSADISGALWVLPGVRFSQPLVFSVRCGLWPVGSGVGGRLFLPPAYEGFVRVWKQGEGSGGVGRQDDGFADRNGPEPGTRVERWPSAKGGFALTGRMSPADGMATGPTSPAPFAGPGSTHELARKAGTGRFLQGPRCNFSFF